MSKILRFQCGNHVKTKFNEHFDYISVFYIDMEFIVFLSLGYVIHASLLHEYKKFDCGAMSTKGSSVICKSLENSTLELPDFIPYNVHLLYIDARNGGTLAITKIDTFRRFKLLSTIEISVSKSLHISENLIRSYHKSDMSAEIFHLPRLQSLSIEYEEFNRQNYEWKLPKTMVKVRLANSVFKFDLEQCAGLRGLRLIQNEMSTIPVLHEHAVAFFRKLELKYNLMNNFTANDLARFCRLNVLEITNATINNCECGRIKKWLKEWKGWADRTKWKFNFDTDLACNETINLSCGDYTLTEAKRLKNICLEKRNSASRSIPHWIVVAIMSFFGLENTSKIIIFG